MEGRHDLRPNHEDIMKAKKLNKTREKMMMFRHSTIKWQLTPPTILETAKSDLRAKAMNAEMRKARMGLPPGSKARKLIGPLRQFAFVPSHVRAAKTPANLLKKAIEDRSAGRSAQNVNTVAIYSDNAGLWAALALTEGECQ